MATPHYLALRCGDCVSRPVMGCGRCNTTRCAVHALPNGERCERCEGDWDDDAVSRRAAKMIFAPPIAILSGGLLFLMLLPVSLPISLGGALGAAFMCTLACTIAFAAGTATCRIVDRSARAMFLRERSTGLPPARLLPSPRHR